MAINNNFGFPKGENGTIGAFVKVSKNIDKELKDAGASIQGFMQGQPTGELYTIRFPVNSLDKISEIDGLVYLDTGEKMTMQLPKINPSLDKDLLNKQYQDALNQQNNLSNTNVGKYVFKEDFEATGSNIIDNNWTDQEYLKLIHKFKKGDVFDGEKIPVNAGVNPNAEKYDIKIITPNNFLEDGTFVYYKGVFQVPERIVSEQTFLQKNKTNLLIAGVLVLGYLAYKKFKK
jgi:hypothetical protein